MPDHLPSGASANIAPAAFGFSRIILGCAVKSSSFAFRSFCKPSLRACTCALLGLLSKAEGLVADAPKALLIILSFSDSAGI